MTELRIVLIGAVRSTEVALARLVALGHPPVLLVTSPPEKASVNSDYVDLRPLARASGIDILESLNVNGAREMARIRGAEPNLICVIGWSRLCGPELLALASGGVLGYHPTLLPKMRGRAALAWTILLDLRETGGTLFWIDEGTDSGPIAAQRAFPLTGEEQLADLYALHLDALAGMLDELVPQLIAGRKPAVAQDHGAATYLALRRAEDGLIDWSEPADTIHRLIRAVSPPYPGAYTYLKGRKVSVLAARTDRLPEWHAQIGQVFTYQEGHPVVRCGNGADLVLLDYEVEPDESMPGHGRLQGQVRFDRIGR